MDPVGFFVEDADIICRWEAIYGYEYDVDASSGECYGRLKCLTTGVSLSLQMSNLC